MRRYMAILPVLMIVVCAARQAAPQETAILHYTYADIIGLRAVAVQSNAAFQACFTKLRIMVTSAEALNPFEGMNEARAMLAFNKLNGPEKKASYQGVRRSNAALGRAKIFRDQQCVPLATKADAAAETYNGALADYEQVTRQNVLEKRRDALATAALFYGLALGFKPAPLPSRPINCTSIPLGNTVQTNCH